MSEILATYQSPEVWVEKFTIPNKYFKYDGTKISDYFGKPGERLHYKELCKYEEVKKELVIDKATGTRKTVETRIPKEKIIDCVVSLVSPYILGFEYCHNFKQLVTCNLHERLVIARVYNKWFPHEEGPYPIGSIYNLKSNPKLMFEVRWCDSTHVMVMAISTDRLGWDFNTLLIEHFEHYFNLIV